MAGFVEDVNESEDEVKDEFGEKSRVAHSDTIIYTLQHYQTIVWLEMLILIEGME